MPHVLKHPALPDYFLTSAGDRNHVADYEGGAVVVLPNQAAAIDTAFWSALPIDDFAALKKFKTAFGLDAPPPRDRLHADLLAVVEQDDLAARMTDKIIELYDALMPLYRTVFAGYRFPKTRAIFRLNTIMAENVHFDTYREPLPHHFARMFVNLDDRPRIWHTSWPIREAMARYGDLVAPETLSADANSLWNELSWRIFGKSSKQCWDSEPRHIAFFDPGDVWIVDSRQVAHQIFYGRRAVSIDFEVDIASMHDPSTYYLTLAEEFRRTRLDQIAQRSQPSPASSHQEAP